MPYWNKQCTHHFMLTLLTFIWLFPCVARASKITGFTKLQIQCDIIACILHSTLALQTESYRPALHAYCVVQFSLCHPLQSQRWKSTSVWWRRCVLDTNNVPHSQFLHRFHRIEMVFINPCFLSSWNISEQYYNVAINYINIHVFLYYTD